MVQKALQLIEQDDENTLQQQLELTQIPAPSNDERNRALRVKELLEAAGYAVEMDQVSNVYTTLPGTGEGPTVMLAAHLDTVFPAGTDVTVRREGEKYCAPGITDDTRAVAELLSIARALRQSGLKTVGNLVLCANVGEEGLGNLRGVRHIFETRRDLDAFVSIDLPATEGIVFGATGSYRYRVTYRGPGGHSFAAFGLPNPIHALGRAVGEIAKLRTPEDPKTTFNVGVIGGGTSVNSIPYEASMLIDMRSNSAQELDKLDQKVMALVRQAAQEENDHWHSEQKVTVQIEQLGNRPAGMQPGDCTIVQVFEAANRAVGFEPKLMGASSTDCNIPISLGVPAVAVGRGGKGGQNHSLEEWFIPLQAYKGPQKDLLGVLALVGVQGVSEPMLKKG